jgi:hypothetical protein
VNFRLATVLAPLCAVLLSACGDGGAPPPAPPAAPKTAAPTDAAAPRIATIALRDGPGRRFVVDVAPRAEDGRAVVGVSASVGATVVAEKAAASPAAGPLTLEFSTDGDAPAPTLAGRYADGGSFTATLDVP